MKSATVKPIPAADPVATIFESSALSGRSATFALDAAYDAATTPSGLPITNPMNIHHAIAEVAASRIDSDVITTPVFAKAKSGTMARLEYG